MGLMQIVEVWSIVCTCLSVYPLYIYIYIQLYVVASISVATVPLEPLPNLLRCWWKNSMLIATNQFWPVVESDILMKMIGSPTLPLSQWRGENWQIACVCSIFWWEMIRQMTFVSGLLSLLIGAQVCWLWAASFKFQKCYAVLNWYLSL